MGTKQRGKTMNNLEQYLFDNQELIADFLKDNKELLNEIKTRFENFSQSGDFVGRYLLSQALLQILKVATTESKALLKTEMALAGVNITDAGGSC